MPSLPLDRPALMASLVNFLHRKKFVYTSDSEQRFSEFRESIKKGQPASTDSILKCYSVLQHELERLKEQDMLKESGDVAQELEVEIVRHYNEHMARHAELDHDLAVKKAIELFSDSRSYSRILHP